MKKVVCVIIALLILCSCSPKENKSATENARQEKILGVWISCYELKEMLDGGNFKEEFAAASKKLGLLGVGDAFVHVRAFGESLFESKYYPQNEGAKQYDFDVLEYMIEVLRENNIRFHAWINPFRAPDGSVNNPADEDVRTKIVLGIREIIDRYKISGIHFDDYFYPSENSSIDEDSYASYIASGKIPITLAEYRTATITSLVYSVKNAVKYKNKDILFSISPAADIEKNQTQAFADITYWCESGAVDMIIPQLYFGFDYPQEKYRFENLLNEWRAIPRAKGVKLVIGLASYKLGTKNEPDCTEWETGTDILARQVAACLNQDDVSGVCFFSYSSLFIDDELHNESLSAVREEMKRQQ